MQVQVCPKCGSEFQPHVMKCLDCGAATEARWEVPGAPPAPAPPAPTDFSLPRDAEASAVRFGDLHAATELAVFLEERGVPSRVDSMEPGTHRHRYYVLVAPEDYERARALDREHLAAVVPEGEAVTTEPPPGHCPACGARVPDEALECPDCGLVVGGGAEGAESASE